MKKKILLLHGWNWKNYTNMTDSIDAWENRKDFVSDLEKNYEVYKLNFPGFCGQEEPNKPYVLDDYASFVKDYLKNNNLKVDYVLGYSFGGAVALRYHLLYDDNQKIILISPAIIRNKTKSKDILKTPGFMHKLRKVMRDWYLIYIIKNPYMVHGTKFLNASYQNIVRVELIEDLKKINPKMINIIYGSIDDQVNPIKVIENVSSDMKKKITVIEGGGHDIANTHREELIGIIDNYEKDV